MLHFYIDMQSSRLLHFNRIGFGHRRHVLPRPLALIKRSLPLTNSSHTRSIRIHASTGNDSDSNPSAKLEMEKDQAQAGSTLPLKFGILPLIHSAWTMIDKHFWPLALVFCLCDAIQFVLHRVAHRVTNQVCLALFSSKGVNPDSIGNLWYLSANPEIANFDTGYQFIAILIFLCMFPLNLLLRSTALSAAVLTIQGRDALTTEADQAEPSSSSSLSSETPTKKKGVRAWLRDTFGSVWAVRGDVGGMWKRVFWVEWLSTIRIIPLQLLSLLVIPLFWTLPRLADLQMATTVSIVDPKQEGMKALEQSKELAANRRRALLTPVLLSLALAKIFEILNITFVSYTVFFLERGVGEVPLFMWFVFTFLTFVVHRIRELTPFAAYRMIDQKA